jgi:HEAT repeat protein
MKDDYFRHRLALAAQCLPEIPPRIRMSVLKEVNNITREVVRLSWRFAKEEMSAAVPHLIRALPALGLVNAEVERGKSLTEWLTSKAIDRQEIAIEMIGQVGPPAAVPEIVQILIELGQMPELARTDKMGMPRNLQGFLNPAKWWPDARVSFTALRTLRALVSTAASPMVIDKLRLLMRDENSDVRTIAARAVCNFGSFAATPVIVNCLLELLQDEYAMVRIAAAQALGTLGSAVTPEVVRALQASMQKGEEGTYEAAAKALGALASYTDTAEIVHSLLTPQGPKDWSAQCVIAKSVGALGSAANRPEVVCTLLELLRDENSVVRWEAADAVRSLSNAAAVHPEVVGALLELLWDDDLSVRIVATEAVCALGSQVPPGTVNILLDLLQDDDWGEQEFAAEALGALGSSAATPEALQRLCALMRNADLHVRINAARAVRALGRSATVHPEVVEVLLELLGENDRDVRRQAAFAFAALAACGESQFFVCL